MASPSPASDPDSTRVLLIRHAESRPSREVLEPDWPLSPAGVVQSERLAGALEPLGLTALYSSPYRRAVATLEPFAALSSLPIGIELDLRERKLTDGFHPNHLGVARKAWEDLAFALPGCETGLDCRQRVRRVVDRLAAKHPGERIALASHGNAIALYLGSLDGRFGFDEWSAMRNPDVFTVDYPTLGSPVRGDALAL